MTKVHLLEDVADLPSKAGQMLINQSYSVAIASDELASKINIFPPQNAGGIVEKPSSENTSDSLGTPRQIQSNVLFRDVSRYDLDAKQWSYQLADTTNTDSLPVDTTNTDSLPVGTESIIWSQRINARATYPGSLTEVKYIPGSSAIQIINYPVNSNVGLQQTVLFSNRVFNAATSPIFVTMAVSMTLSDNINCSKTWGLLSGNAGYFFRIYGNGQSNNFKVGYKFTIEQSTTEIEISRNQFNGDKLNGTGRTSHTQTFTNIGMFGLEIGTAGYGARFWAYVESGNKAEWVLVHSLYNDSDGSQNRITDEESYPISFEVKNIGQSTTLQTLTKYGTSVASIGSAIATSDINSINISKSIVAGRLPYSILTIQTSNYINNKKNVSSVLAARLNLLASNGAWRIVLIKNPTFASLDWLNVGTLSSVQYRINDNIFLTGGIIISSFLLFSNKPLSIDLSNIFALNRSFLTTQYTNDNQFLGDYGQQFLLKSDILCVGIVDANIPVDSNEVIWNSASLINATPTYEFASSLSISNLLPSTIHCSLNILEV